MAKYNDIYMRAYLGDPGDVPRNQSKPISSSPDLIPIGMQPVPPDSLLTTESWNSIYNSSLVVNTDNYLYMRAQNLGTEATTGVFSLYFSKASLLLYPDLWSKNQMKTQSNADTQSVLIQPGAKGVTPAGFIWKPEQIVNDHYCLVGMVSTPNHPATPPPDGEIRNFASWIAANGSFAWHNVSVTSAGTPTFTKQIWYPQGSSTDEVRFDIICTNVPENSKVAFSCAAAGANPPINLKPTIVSTYPSFIAGVKSTIQAGFEAYISYSYWAVDGGPPPEGFNITIEASIPTTNGDALYRHGRTLQERGFPTPEEYLEMKKAMKKWDKVSWEVHEEYAAHLHQQHTEAGTYKKSAAGPIRYFTVGSDSVYGQSVKN